MSKYYLKSKTIIGLIIYFAPTKFQTIRIPITG